MDQSQTPKPQRNRAVLQAGAAALVIILYIAVVVYSKKHDQQSPVQEIAEVGDTTQVVNSNGNNTPVVDGSGNGDNDNDDNDDAEDNASPAPSPAVTPLPAATAPTPKPTPPPVVAPPPVVTPPPASSSSSYRDGAYAATGNYSSPGGREQIGVSLTLKDGVVTAATVTPQATNPTSKAFQQDFAENYKTFVVGKNIDTLSLKKVSGSSLTPIGFNAAVEQIKTQSTL